mgnify:CR=1 FL=1
MKTAAVLAIGNELLSAKIRDSNTYYLASELREAGVSLSIAMIVADEVDAIVDAIHFARKRADVVLTTGGVGPTPPGPGLPPLPSCSPVAQRMKKTEKN